jgi:hypothetical protein
LPDIQRQESVLNVLGPYRQSQRASTKTASLADRFRSATLAAGLPVPHVSETLTRKYVADPRHLDPI